MRSEAEMLKLVLSYAENDERVRAVGLNGSRADPGARQDCLQDYDIVYYVRELDSFVAEPGWVQVFGRTAVMQTPEAMTLFPPELHGWFSYLMQFCDGTRIDLCLVPLADFALSLKVEPYTRPLLDKDGLFDTWQPPQRSPWLLKMPSAAEYADCCNEFWWVSCYVAKGLWRQELLYANHHLEHIMRPMLFLMLRWWAGTRHGFEIETGKSDRYLQRYLPADMWQALCVSYRCDGYEACWQSLWGCCALFRRAGQQVAQALGCAYPQNEDDGATAYLNALAKAGPGGCPVFEEDGF